jgi:DNA-binding CsgD family transcriptional regulator/tetratricopeptide (TPR) repeat protein
MPAEPSPTGETPLVGREQELGELIAGLERAIGGRGQVLLLVGEPGIGKTRTAEELAAVARGRGALVLWGRCFEWEGSPAYWPWIQLMRGYLHDCDPQALRVHLGAGAADIAQIVPEIREHYPDLPDVPPLEPEQARFRLFDAITTSFKRASEARPLVLILDDLHWADTPSLLLVRFLASALQSAPILLAGTYRNVEVGRHHPLADTLAELARDARSTRVPLRRLAKDEVAQLITHAAGRAPSAELLDAVYRETEGNPFFVIEVVRLLAAEGRFAASDSAPTWRTRVPESVREVIGRRLNRLSEACNRALIAASVIGRDFSVSVLEQVCEVPLDALLDLLDEAVGARLAEEGSAPGRYRFSHALIRETLYDELSTARRLRLHRRVGEVLESLYAADLAPHYDELAHHFVEAAAAGGVEKALTYAVKAGDQALAQLGYEASVGHYQRALQLFDLADTPDELQRYEVLLSLGDAQTRAASTELATATYQQAARLARRLGQGDLFARATLASDDASLDRSQLDASWTELLEAALAELSPVDSALRAKVMARLALALFNDPACRDRGVILSGEAVAMARRLGDPAALAYALLARVFVCWTPATLDERLVDVAEVVGLTYAIEDWQLALYAHHWQLANLLERGDVQAVDAELAAFARLAQALRQPRDLSLVFAFRAMRAGMVGRLDEAEDLARQALATSPESHHIFTDQLLYLRREQGRLAEVEAAVAEVAARSPLLGWTAALARLYAELGRLAEAQTLLDRLAVDEFASVEREGFTWLASAVSLAETSIVLGATQHAETLYRLLLPYAERYVNAGGGWFHGAVAYELGRLATMLARWEEAATHFTAALEMHERVAARSFVAHTQYSWAEMLVRRGEPGDREQALELVEHARVTAEELGMIRLTEQATALQSTLAPATPAVSSAPATREQVHNLTPRELEVLRLLVDGRSDREIAEALYISPRTVMTHVMNILNKLGVNSRTAAASHAIRHGIA